ncbi:hypothetical protein tinsulaeT_37980 [Thalassotalea insulae]|uniref:DUF58 domain-containing protein n=1 Tax=Thalassotalea insulae TaxID=2056778 RepID=A0ABQ6GWZ3_9GAMM|nr:DUF58 domain-containing protein [Thalassotalea insulae]GLX80458.1 hypothetical protein tinsulaeT_37980 [Thalassotalea insulae]
MVRDYLWQQKIRQRLTNGFARWLQKRMPSRDHQGLSQRNIFIFPSRFGFVFLGFICLLFILATNYQNNLILLMSYLLSSLFVTSMLASFINISGLALSAKGQYLGFTEQDILVPVTMETDVLRHDIALSFDINLTKNLPTLAQTQLVKVPVSFAKRGRYRLPRLTLASYYPLGLFRCWTHLQFDLEAIVCPKPLHCLTHNTGQHWREQDKENPITGQSPASDNFYELRSYNKGDSLNQVAWKYLAKTGQWYSKSYQAQAVEPDILSLDQLPAGNIETKLRQLCFLILEYDGANLDYGLELNSEVIEPGHGQAHLQQCLKKLATYGQQHYAD